MKVLSFSKQYDSHQLEVDIKNLVNNYPFIKVTVIGYSVLNTPIWELQIGEGDKQVHWNGAFHANEWITTPLLVKALEEYATAIVEDGLILGQSAMDLFKATSLSIVPMVNPDGVDLFMHGSVITTQYKKLLDKINHQHVNFSSWKANIRGVDLNNQFPANWELEQKRKPQHPSFRDYPGSDPLTEPEAQAMFSLTKSRDFQRVLAFHSQGEVIYWGYQNNEPMESRSVVEAYRKVSRYEPVHTIDSHAGYKDWFINEFKREGYTVEVGKGVNPLPWSTFLYQYKNVLAICVKSLVL